MNHDAINAHLRLMERRDLQRRSHEQQLYVIPQGGRMSREMRERVRALLRVHSVEQVSEITGLHRRTVGRIRDQDAQ